MSDWQSRFVAAKAAQDDGRWDQALAGYEFLLRDLPGETASRVRGGPTGDPAAGPCPDGEAAIEILRRIGAVHYYRGDLELAAEVLELSCAAAAAHGSLRHLASGLNFSATVQQAAGRLDAAEATYLEAQAVAEAAGHTRLVVMIEQNLGTIASVRGNCRAALQRYDRALRGYEQSGDAEGTLWVLNNLGMVRTDLGDWEAADCAFDRALELATGRGDHEMLGTIQLNRADCFLQRERFDEARLCIDHAFELFGRLGARAGIGEAYRLYGSLYRAAGKSQLADAHLVQATELAEAAGYLLLEAEARAEHALVHLELGRNPDALRSLNRAHRLFRELGARRELLDLERRLDSLEQTYLHVVRAWGESIESKDRYTAGHCSRVADLTVCLAEAVGFEGRELTWIRMGAFLHDVGKTTVDAAVLNKPGKLDDAEWEQMKNHTTVGDAIVADLDFPYDIRPIVRSHHERWDGRGYPDGLAGESIPLIARILCVADVYDALTTTRSYRAAHSQERALAIMAEESGKLFDPRLFNVFRRLTTSGALPEMVAAA